MHLSNCSSVMHTMPDTFTSRATLAMRLRGSRRQASGRSLVELMIVLLISLIVMGAVILTVSGTSMTGEQQDVQARLNEDAAVAAHLLTSQLRMGGYTVLTSAPSAGAGAKPGNYVGPPVRGCEGDYTVVNNLASNACNAGATDTVPDSITVYFEADAFNTTPNAVGGPPTDCLGRNIPNVPFPLATNRYYIGVAQNGTPGLFCYGAGGGLANGMLVPNVIDMDITYGVAAVGTTFTPQTEATQYLRADQVAALATLTDPTSSYKPVRGWDRVVSLRVCLVMQSDNNAVPDTSAAGGRSYTGCRGRVINLPNADRRLYRTIETVVALRNRTAPCLRSSVRLQSNGDTNTMCTPA
jgi:type IV pilus assembly protein PilW